MAEIIQHHHKNDEIQFEIIVRSRSVECHSAMNDMPDTDKQTIKHLLSDLAKEYLEQYFVYTKK